MTLQPRCHTVRPERSSGWLAFFEITPGEGRSGHFLAVGPAAASGDDERERALVAGQAAVRYLKDTPPTAPPATLIDGVATVLRHEALSAGLELDFGCGVIEDGRLWYRTHGSVRLVSLGANGATVYYADATESVPAGTTDRFFFGKLPAEVEDADAARDWTTRLEQSGGGDGGLILTFLEVAGASAPRHAPSLRTHGRSETRLEPAVPAPRPEPPREEPPAPTISGEVGDEGADRVHVDLDDTAEITPISDEEAAAILAGDLPEHLRAPSPPPEDPADEDPATEEWGLPDTEPDPEGEQVSLLDTILATPEPVHPTRGRPSNELTIDLGGDDTIGHEEGPEDTAELDAYPGPDSSTEELPLPEPPTEEIPRPEPPTEEIPRHVPEPIPEEHAPLVPAVEENPRPEPSVFAAPPGAGAFPEPPTEEISMTDEDDGWNAPPPVPAEPLPEEGGYAPEETRGLAFWLGVVTVLAAATLLVVYFLVWRPQVGDVPVPGNDGSALEAGEPPDAVASPALAWEVSFPQGVSSSPRLTPAGVVFGGRDGGVYCLSPRDGTRVWAYAASDGFGSSPALADGLVFIGGYDGRLYALDAATGDEQWTAQTGGRIVSSPVVADGRVFIGSYDHKLYAFRVADGGPLWEYDLGDVIWATPAVADDAVFVASLGGNVLALETESGRVRWRREVSGKVYSSPATGEGKVFLGTEAGLIHAFDQNRGETAWTLDAGAEVQGAATFHDGRVFLGTEKGTVLAIDAQLGAAVWTGATAGPVRSRPGVRGRTVWVTSYDGFLHGFDLTTGEESQSYEFGTSAFSSPALGDAMAFFGGLDGRFFAIRLPAGG